MNRLWSFVLILISVVMCCVVFLVYTYFFVLKSNGVVKVLPGDGVHRFAINASSAMGVGVIGEFYLGFVMREGVRFGHYRFYSGESLLKFAKRVKSGNSEGCVFTFVPGKTIHLYKTQLMSDGNFSGDVSVDIPEGGILPETYLHRCQTPRDKILLYANESMGGFIKSVTAGIDMSAFYLKNMNEILTMASIVEKETGVNDERAMVASVFKNRLKIGMKLQTDPTVIYQESNKTGELGRALTADDLKVDGLYNTYTINGLPVGPISNPSMESVYAILNPAETDYLYFVSNGNGGHNFSKTYAEHLRFVDEYRKKSVGSSTCNTDGVCTNV
jgi:UPF0755 protein